jgi:hypothetical protein
MAFKMKGPMFFSSALKNYRDTTKYKAFQGGNEAGSSLKHKVDDNPEHQETYGDDHSDDLQTEEEHGTGKVESKSDDRTYYNELVKKEKDGTIIKNEQNALDRLRAEEG